MNPDNYEQEGIPADVVGASVQFLWEGMQVSVQLFEGRPISVAFSVHRSEGGGNCAADAFRPGEHVEGSKARKRRSASSAALHRSRGNHPYRPEDGPLSGARARRKKKGDVGPPAPVKRGSRILRATVGQQARFLRAFDESFPGRDEMATAHQAFPGATIRDAILNHV
jgi:Elongation factor P (EF-P) OB domain